jgi:hypothetical protein
MAAIVEKARIGPASIYSKTPVRRYAECLFNGCPMHPFAETKSLMTLSTNSFRSKHRCIDGGC